MKYTIIFLLNSFNTAPYSTGLWHHWVVGIGLAAAVLASSGQGSWGMAAAWRHLVWDIGPAG